MARRQIEPQELGHFSIDDDHRLYWDDDLVQTSTRIALSSKQTWWGIVVALATILGASASAIYTAFYICTFHKAPTGTTLTVTATAPSIQLVPLGCVGPFVSGKSNILEQTSNARESVRAPCGGADSIKQTIANEKTSPLAFVFVGAADKFEPSRSVRQIYGSNDGLAQARAEWVIRDLGYQGSAYQDGKMVIVSLARGPKIYGINATNGKSAYDRTVDVYGLWPRESSSTASVR